MKIRQKMSAVWAVLLVMASLGTAGAQECGTEEVFRQALLADTALPGEMVRQQEFIRDFTRRLVDSRSPSGEPLYVIPVVFHVIHSGGNDNVPEDRLLAALQRLNDDFNRRNADAAEAPPPFRGLAAAARIEFRRARLDPDGGCTDGIVRIFTPTYPRKESEILALSRWPVDRYLNVWVVQGAVDEAGHAYGAYARYPQAADNGNGIFMSARFLNDLDFASVEPDLLTHEAGHWLNLTHIWGNTNAIHPVDGCALDDFVDDTPRQEGANFGCPGFPHFSCEGETHGDNFSNFMDYTLCRNMFTAGQRDRMWAALNSSLAGRNHLWTPENLATTGADAPGEISGCPVTPQVDFGWGQYYDVYCPGSLIPFYATVAGGEVTQWRWSFEGGTPSSSSLPDPQVRFDAPGDYRVQLIAVNDYGRDTVSRMIRVQFLPENIAYTGDDLLEDFEDDRGTREYVFFDSFRDGSWEFVEGTSRGTGNRSLQLHNPTFPQRAVPIRNSNDGFLTPYFDTRGINAGDLTFHIAYNNLIASEDASIVLRISAYPDCGNESRIVVGTLTSGVIKTPEYVFPPVQERFWKKISLALPEAVLAQGRIRFFFELFHRQGEVPDFFIDDLAIEPSALTSTGSPMPIRWLLYPNPAGEAVTVTLPEDLPLPAKLSVTDVAGNHLLDYSLAGSTDEIDVSRLAPGVYLFYLQTGGRRSSRRLIIARP